MFLQRPNRTAEKQNNGRTSQNDKMTTDLMSDSQAKKTKKQNKTIKTKCNGQKSPGESTELREFDAQIVRLSLGQPKFLRSTFM